MFRPANDQKEEKDLFKRQLSALKLSKWYLIVDLFFLIATIVCVIFTSPWFILASVFILYKLKNRFFDYRFNKAMALMLVQSSSFNVTNEEKDFIEYFL